MNNCIFCKIANGEMNSYTVFENESFRVILDISPVSIGHCLVIPKKHFKNVFEIDEQTISEGFKISKKIASALKCTFDLDGINILQNDGEAAGQTIDHFHIHVIPRKKNDNAKIFSDTLKLSEEEFENIKSKIIENL